jgi:ribosomal protein L27
MPELPRAPLKLAIPKDVLVSDAPSKGVPQSLVFVTKPPATALTQNNEKLTKEFLPLKSNEGLAARTGEILRHRGVKLYSEDGFLGLGKDSTLNLRSSRKAVRAEAEIRF